MPLTAFFILKKSNLKCSDQSTLDRSLIWFNPFAHFLPSHSHSLSTGPNRHSLSTGPNRLVFAPQTNPSSNPRRTKSKVKRSAPSMSISASAMSIASNESLPIVDCPHCHLPILRLVSKTKQNPGKVFYKCRNYQKMKAPNCKFYLWEDDYREYLEETGILTKMEDCTVDETIEPVEKGDSKSACTMDHFMEQLDSWKKAQDSQLVMCVEQIKWLVAIMSIMMFSILIILVSIMLLHLYK